MKNLALLGILSVLALGCGDDDGRGSDRDSGGLTLMDSGTIVLPDTGTTPTMDGGGSTTCEPVVFPLPTEPGCTAEQGTELNMILGMTDMAARMAAFNAWLDDPANEGCLGCIDEGITACSTMNGCDDEAGNLLCCLEDACPSADATCVNGARMGACSTQDAAFGTCAQDTIGATCNIPAECFPG